MTKHEANFTLAATTVNVVNILRVADAIERHEVPELGFNMATFYSNNYSDRSGHNCGTTACIAGWAKVVSGGDVCLSGDVVVVGMKFLGLTYTQAVELFCLNEASSQVLDPITSGEAVRTLRHLAATGEVRWDLPAA